VPEPWTRAKFVPLAPLPAVLWTGGDWRPGLNLDPIPQIKIDCLLNIIMPPMFNKYHPWDDSKAMCYYSTGLVFDSYKGSLASNIKFYTIIGRSHGNCPFAHVASIHWTT